MKRILIVDDEPLILRVLKPALERAGFEVETRCNGKEALARILEEAPDVLVTDIDMPRMTGEELCKLIHEHIPDRKFPIFVCTSITATQHRVWSSAIPNLQFLEKPISVSRLNEAILGSLDTPPERAARASG